MAAAAASLKWVDVLETQFDKSWVDLDLLLSQIEEVLICVQTAFR